MNPKPHKNCTYYYSCTDYRVDAIVDEFERSGSGSGYVFIFLEPKTWVARYIGSGCGSPHLVANRETRYNIKKIWGYAHAYILCEGMTPADAKALARQLIKVIGTEIAGTGPLFNRVALKKHH